jgi:hypothetical protein
MCVIEERGETYVQHGSGPYSSVRHCQAGGMCVAHSLTPTRCGTRRRHSFGCVIRSWTVSASTSPPTSCRLPPPSSTWCVSPSPRSTGSPCCSAAVTDTCARGEGQGCSVGISTRAIHQRFPTAAITGLDLCVPSLPSRSLSRYIHSPLPRGWTHEPLPVGGTVAPLVTRGCSRALSLSRGC